MASVSRCRLSLVSFQKSASSLTRKSSNCVAETTKCAVGQPCLNSRIRTICGSALQQNSKISIVQAVTKSFTSQTSRCFHQKFPPVLGCNPISIAVAENLIGASELEDSSEGEDEATSGRKRIRSKHLLDDDP